MNNSQTDPDKIENGFKSHMLKTDPDVFHAVLIGLKTYEIRYDDRNFNAGDSLYLRETKYSGDEMMNGGELIYTGRSTIKTITHILEGPSYGLKENWVIMSII